MQKNILTLLMLLSLGSCTRYAFFQSPLHNNTNVYKEMPLQRDSVSSAVYASGVYSSTALNEGGDSYSAFHAGLHRSYSFSHFQGYYGLSGSLGNYKVDSIRYIFEPTDNGWFDNRALNDSLINANSGNKFFGSYGVVGGINVVHQWPHGEWRVLGLGLAINREFGKYLDFRNKLPDTSANLIDRNRTTVAVGLSTDFIRRTPNGLGL